MEWNTPACHALAGQSLFFPFRRKNRPVIQSLAFDHCAQVHHRFAHRGHPSVQVGSATRPCRETRWPSKATPRPGTSPHGCADVAAPVRAKRRNPGHVGTDPSGGADVSMASALIGLVPGVVCRDSCSLNAFFARYTAMLVTSAMAALSFSLGFDTKSWTYRKAVRGERHPCHLWEDQGACGCLRRNPGAPYHGGGAMPQERSLPWRGCGRPRHRTVCRGG